MRLRSGRKADPAVFRITGARRGLHEDVLARQRRYVISMLVRTLAVLLTVALWNVSRPLAVVALVLGAVLPYVAVVVANAGRENVSSLPSTFITRDAPPTLPPGPGDAHNRN
ncbi:DUF3099 domain-containing protein [Streptomyces sp. NPDC127098]|uniref:DUF3099 domain-containing protein n=1 Tax=Streptomyces sp. NPDC127098 TaxID=3347137 RepID=UPI00365E84D8